jgi:hypothetical protein
MTALQWIVKEAKRLKKQYPNRFLTWKEYVAQASTIYASKNKGKSPVGKKRKPKAKKHNVYKVTRTKSGLFKKGGIKKIGPIKKHIPESKVLHEIEKVKSDIKTLEQMQKQHMMKKHKSSIGATIRKKHSEIKKLLKKY